MDEKHIDERFRTIDAIFDGHREALRIKSSEVDRRLNCLEEWRKVVSERITIVETNNNTYTTIVGFILTILTIVLHFWK